MELVIAPLPKAAARPATVEECQSRAQWSTLFVSNCRPGKFLQQIILLVGHLGRGKKADGIRAVFALDLLEPCAV